LSQQLQEKEKNLGINKRFCIERSESNERKFYFTVTYADLINRKEVWRTYPNFVSARYNSKGSVEHAVDQYGDYGSIAVEWSDEEVGQKPYTRKSFPIWFIKGKGFRKFITKDQVKRVRKELFYRPEINSWTGFFCKSNITSVWGFKGKLNDNTEVTQLA